MTVPAIKSLAATSGLGLVSGLIGCMKDEGNKSHLVVTKWKMDSLVLFGVVLLVRTNHLLTVRYVGKSPCIRDHSSDCV